MNYTVEALMQICKENDLHVQINPTGTIEVTSVAHDIEVTVSSIEEMVRAFSVLSFLKDHRTN